VIYKEIYQLSCDALSSVYATTLPSTILLEKLASSMYLISYGVKSAAIMLEVNSSCLILLEQITLLAANGLFDNQGCN
jgi:hypothetical protein